MKNSMYNSDHHFCHLTLELQNLAARLGDDCGPPRRLRAEWAKSCSCLKKGQLWCEFWINEAIGVDQSFEAQLWRSRRTELPLTGARSLRAECAKSCSALKKARCGVKFWCNEAIGVDQCFESQL